jgi:hypothetical protein
MMAEPTDVRSRLSGHLRFCSVYDACGGVFTTSGNRLSQHLRPIP